MRFDWFHTAEISSLGAGLRDQSLCLFLCLLLGDHHHGSGLLDHAQVGRSGRICWAFLSALRGGKSRSCHPVPGLRDGVALQRLWIAVFCVSRVFLPSLKRLTCSCCSSSFFASKSSLGTPIALSCALSMRSHNSLQKAGVSLFRKPVSWIWISLILGCGK